MSIWAEIKKAINSDLTVPLDKKLARRNIPQAIKMVDTQTISSKTELVHITGKGRVFACIYSITNNASHTFNMTVDNDTFEHSFSESNYNSYKPYGFVWGKEPFMIYKALNGDTNPSVFIANGYSEINFFEGYAALRPLTDNVDNNTKLLVSDEPLYFDNEFSFSVNSDGANIDKFMCVYELFE